MKGWVTRNLGLKFLAVVFSAALWFFVAGQSNTEVGLVVPLGFSGVPKEMVMTSAPIGEIDVRVRGSKFVISKLSSSQITAELDLSKAREGDNRYKLRAGNITVPTGVEVVRVSPTSVVIRFEKIIKAVVPVRARWKGTPALGYRVLSVKVEPESVEVEGLKKRVKALKTIYTRTIDISGLKESKGFTVELNVGDTDFKKISTNKVGVTVLIAKKKGRGRR
ncbi:MAG: CdaR family protein [Thermodesulfobacteriota bacterium]|nr:MAG: CdaR family protein [Thermodesulfobacteriota bacterium]